MSQSNPEQNIEELFRRAGLGGPGGTKRKPPRALLAFVGVIFLLGFAGSLNGLYADWLWFRFDAQQPAVFAKALTWRVGLWLVGFVVAFAILWWNARLALKAAFVYKATPRSSTERLAGDVLGFVEKSQSKLVALGAGLLAILFAANFSRHAEVFWWFQAAVPFGKEDPLFGRDLSFFVFQLPLIQLLLGNLLGLLALTFLVVVALFIGLRSVANAGKVELTGSSFRTQVSWLGGLALINLAAIIYVNRYAAGLEAGSQFTGPGLAGIQSLGIRMFLAIITGLVGVLTIINSRAWRPYRVPAIGVPVLLVLGVLLGGLWPAIIQRFRVEPDKLVIEAPYAANAIEMTRYAYGLDKFRVQDFAVKDEPTEAEIAAASSTLENMRLWDPTVLRSSFEQLQGLKSFYRFADVDIDRYDIGGEQRMVMLSVRDIDTEGLAANSRAWVNTRLQYTHGFGLAMSQVNQATSNGRPQFLVKDFPPVSTVGMQIDQPRIYFSDYRAAGFEESGYAIVNTQTEEFDYPSGDEERTYRWTGRRGVPMAGLMTRLVYSAYLNDFNLLVTPNVTSGSRLLYRRSVLDRARTVYPMLSFDTDPYVVLFEGRLKWILDAYTTTDRIPYSDMTFTGSGALNYIRNSAKVVIDAYTGDMTAYAIDEDEPLLRAYQRIYPGLVRPASEIPERLREHFRYGEDKFMIQALKLREYHVTDPTAFLNNSRAWEIPTEKGRQGGSETMLPYYVQMRLPGENRDGFMLILPFTPRAKNNMIGWMAAHCDPEQFGEVILYRFPETSATLGPNQMESRFDQDNAIAQINRELNNDQSQIIPGNLLVIPIGSSMMYAKPLFLRSRDEGQVPELRKVILALQDRIVVGNTYEEALEMLFGDRKDPSPQPPTEPTTRAISPPSADSILEVREALKLLDQADEALRAGDFARYGQLQKEGRDRLRRLTEPAEPANE